MGLTISAKLGVIFLFIHIDGFFKVGYNGGDKRVCGKKWGKVDN